MVNEIDEAPGGICVQLWCACMVLNTAPKTEFVPWFGREYAIIIHPTELNTLQEGHICNDT